MLKKDSEIRWNSEAKQSFTDIKDALAKTPVLISPDFSKDLLIFPFASKHIIEGVLLQNNDQGVEQPIAFYSKVLRDAPLKYNIMEK